MKMKVIRFGGGNVTGQIKSGRLQLTDLAPGEAKRFKVLMKPRGRAARGVQKIRINAASAQALSETDRVVAKVKASR